LGYAEQADAINQKYDTKVYLSNCLLRFSGCSFEHNR